MINWKVRLKNKTFWLSAIPAAIIMIQAVAECFGFAIDLGDIGNKLIEIANAVFVILTLLGIVVDPTTTGVGDSARAMTYIKPKGSEDDV